VWGHSGSGAAEVWTTTVVNGSALSGGLTITPTGGDQANDITLSGTASSSLATTISGLITGAGGAAADYAVSYSTTTGQLSIGLSAAGTSAGLTAIAVANDGGAASQVTPVVNAANTPTVLNFSGLTTSDMLQYVQNTLGSNYTASYNSGSGALSIGISTAGGTGLMGAGITSINANTGTVTGATAAATSTTTSTVTLAGQTTAGLVAAVNTALGNQSGGVNQGQYTVAYSGGQLSVGISSQASNPVIGIIGSSTAGVTQSTQSAGTMSVADGETLGGKITLTTQKTNLTTGAVTSPAVTVDLTGGVSTANSGAALISAVNTALGNQAGGANAGDYTVTYVPTSGTGVLSVGVSAAGLAAGFGSVALANGTTTNAVWQSTQTVTNVGTSNTVMGNFSVTPSLSSVAQSPVAIDLDGVTSANLVSTVQAALDTGTAAGDFKVSWDTTAADATVGNLSIGLTQAGVAAGYTGFTVAEATSQAASQETPVTGGVNVYTSDGTSAGSQNYNVTVGTLTDGSVGTSAAPSSTSHLGTQVTTTAGGVTGTGGTLSGAGAGTSLTGTNLNNQADAEAALETIDNAINAVAFQRGQVGANINTLTAASNIASSQMTNITSAQNTITATDYASATSNMSKYEILTQTGISALAQANSTQQMVTKLLQ
ncbi:MAG: flagellin, partial [Acidobacteriaceae bacterium]